MGLSRRVRVSEDVTIRGGDIRDFDVGVSVGQAARAALRGLRVSGGRDGGIVLANSNDSILRGNQVFDNLGDFGAAPGIVLFEESNLSVEGNLVSENGGCRIESEGIDDSRFRRNLFLDNSAGVHLHAASNNLVERNQVSRNGVGIEVSDGVHENRVSNNWVFANTYIGIMTQEGAHRNRIEHNLVLGNGSDPSSESAGIHLFGDGEGERVEGNILIGNDRGVVISGSARSVEIVGNGISRSKNGGILFRNPEHLFSIDRIVRNSVTRNGGDGIFIDAAIPDGTSLYVLERNVATRNGDDGIDVEFPVSELIRNTASRNGDLGIEAVSGVTDGGGNRAFGNGNPLQCLNVACK